MLFELPDWLENRRIEDNMTAQAYANASQTCLGTIKTAIAAHDFNWGRPVGMKQGCCENPCCGFWQKEKTAPADWALVAFPAEYNAAARLCAAVMAPVFAGVDNVFAVCVGGKPCPQALVTLELCGIEDVFCIIQEDFARLARELSCMGIGAMVFLQAGDPGPCVGVAREQGIAFYVEQSDAGLLVADAEYFNDEALGFAQGDFLCHKDSPWTYAIYCAQENVDKIMAEKGRPGSPGLVITPGLEGFWLHPGLGPRFFTKRRLAVGMLARKANMSLL